MNTPVAVLPSPPIGDRHAIIAIIAQVGLSYPMSRLADQIRFCTSRDGTRIAYATCGTGPPLVWVGHWIRHLKFDWDSPVWRPWLSFLTRRHRVVRYDWRGCGLSDRERIEFSLEKHIEDWRQLSRPPVSSVLWFSEC